MLCNMLWFNILYRSKEDVETIGNVLDLVTRNMAIDITEGIRDKKDVAGNIKVSSRQIIFSFLISIYLIIISYIC